MSSSRETGNEPDPCGRLGFCNVWLTLVELRVTRIREELGISTLP
jgi:hypothetical protein